MRTTTMGRAVLWAALGILGAVGCGGPDDDVGARADALVVTASGSVTDANGAPIGDVQLAFRQGGATIASTTSQPDGSWSLALEEGIYDVFVDPPPESVYVPQTLYGQAIDGASSLQIVLVSGGSLRYAAHLVDRDGVALVGLHVCLYPTTGGGGTCATTDASGDVTLNGAPGTHRLQINGHQMPDPEGGGASNPQLPESFDLELGGVVLTGNVSETVTVPNRNLTGVVRDAGGAVVEGAHVYLNVDDYVWDETTGEFVSSSRSDDWAQTGADGRFALSALPGNARLQVSPPAGSGLPSKTETFTIDADADRAVDLPAPALYAAHVVDRDGVALVGLHVCLYGEGGGGGACATTDGSGDVGLSVAPGDYRLQINGHQMPDPEGGGASNPQLPESFDLERGGIVIAGDLTETVTVENRLLTGLVVDAGGAPVANARLSLNTDEYRWDEMTGQFLSSSRSNDWVQTGPDGRFTLRALPGTAQLQVSPEAGSGLPPASETFVLAEDADRTITLAVPVTYAAHLVDRDGAALGGLHVCLYPTTGGGGTCGPTDAAGDVSLSVAPGDYRLQINGHQMPDPEGGGVSNPQLPESFDLELGGIALPADLTETVTVPNRFVRGIVVDVDGNPVPNVSLSLDTDDYVWDETTGEFVSSSRSWDWGQAGADGRFELRALPGQGRLHVQPEPSSGIASFQLARRIVGDESLAVFVQFLSDSVTETVPAGGSAGTDDEGDGATPEDPVETSVTSPTGGTVSIDEVPISQPAPDGYSFLTQQVNIEAPPATVEDPLTLTFTIDASRIPAGMTVDDLEIFRDGSPAIPDCPGSTIADPDPCITSRRLVGDDAVIVVLTSHASAWNIGIEGGLPIDSDFDGVLDGTDDCPAAPEDLDGYQDEDGCPDEDDDGDGVPDTADACPRTPEDLDGYEDEDGCPEEGPEPPPFCPDLDGDGLVTVRDQTIVTRAMGSSAGDRRYRDDADLDDDGDVDVVDLHLLLPHRGEVCAVAPPPCDPEAGDDCGSGPPPDCDPRDPEGGCFDPCAADPMSCECAPDAAGC